MPVVEVRPQDLLENAEALLDERDLVGALPAFMRAEAAGADPDRCAAGRWCVYMLTGDLAAAWRESDSIRARGAPDPNRFWQDEDLAGKRVMLRCLHGFGDAVQFLRYAPRLRELAAQLIIEVPPRLRELAPHINGVDQVITWGPDAPAAPPTWDVQIEINELLYIFRTELRDLPIATRYLHLPAGLQAEARALLGVSHGLKVGIVWTAGEWNPSRSVPVDLLSPIFDVEGCEFWSLQSASNGSHDETASFPKLRRVPQAEDSVLTLAGVISQLDLVITVDTLAAHLAGTLGIPAYVLLQYAADWRWLHARTDSPWYPSLRLFRQSSPGDWTGAILSLRDHVAQLVRRNDRPTRSTA